MLREDIGQGRTSFIFSVKQFCWKSPARARVPGHAGVRTRRGRNTSGAGWAGAGTNRVGMGRGQDAPGPGSTAAGILQAGAPGHADTPVARQPPRARPEPVLPSPAVGRALPLAVSARRTAPIGRPPPLPRPHWCTTLCPRRVTFSRHSPRPLRQPRAGWGAGLGAPAAVIGERRCRSGPAPGGGRCSCLKGPHARRRPVLS